jgi:hypothetical protein
MKKAFTLPSVVALLAALCSSAQNSKQSAAPIAQTGQTGQPKPSFHEESYQDRVAHAIAGMLIIHTTDMRLCEIDAHHEHKVEFGFGILGMLSDKTYLSLVRENVLTGQWTTTKLRVHLDGSILFLESISQDLDSSH